MISVVGKQFKLKKITALMLVFTLLLSFCSCSKSNDGFDGKRFSETRHITVRVESMVDTSYEYPDGVKKNVSNSRCAQYIHDAVLRDCNIDVTFLDCEGLTLGHGTQADVAGSIYYNQLTSYYRMDSVMNLAPILDEYSYAVEDLKALLGDENIYSCTNDPSEIWFISAKNMEPDVRVTFIRKDWLDKLGLETPSTREELYACLIAFRDNADVLLGDDADKMIPFFVDGDPSVSAKPLFDSCFDTSVDDRVFFDHGYRRSTQTGFKDGLEVLNDWYQQDLLPDDFDMIRPLTKETYESIENGYVGVFCAKYDYLYRNGEDSHISALHAACGEDADYIAVNTFEDCYDKYNAWQEDYLYEDGLMFYLPSTCSDPLACLVYLNWLSKTDNIEAVQQHYLEDPSDPYDYNRYLLTCQGIYPSGSLADIPAAQQAWEVANEVNYIQRGCKCVRNNPFYFKYVNSDTDYEFVYPASTQEFVCEVVKAPSGEFEAVYDQSFKDYLGKGAYMIYKLRDNEWEKVMVEGDLKPW